MSLRAVSKLMASQESIVESCNSGLVATQESIVESCTTGLVATQESIVVAAVGGTETPPVGGTETPRADASDLSDGPSSLCPFSPFQSFLIPFLAFFLFFHSTTPYSCLSSLLLGQFSFLVFVSYGAAFIPFSILPVPRST